MACYVPIYKVPWFVGLQNVGTSRGRLAVGCWVRHLGFSFNGNRMLIGHFFFTTPVAVFPLVFLFIVLCGGGMETQVSTLENNSFATYITFPPLSTLWWFLVILWICSI